MVNLNQTLPILFLYIINRINQTLHQSDQQTPCINSLTKQFDKNYTTLINYYQYSGKGYNQLGNYYQCIADQSRKYYIANIEIKNRPTKLFMGICIHNQCSQRQIISFVSNLNFQFKFWNVFNPRDYNKNFPTDAIIVVFILLLFLSLTIISSIMYKIKGQKQMVQNWTIMNNFSLQKTTKNLSKSDQIQFFNGMRVIGAFIVYLFHFIYFNLELNKNPMRIENFWDPILSRVLWDLPNFSVDTFFLMAGFMLAYSFLKSYYKDNQNTQFKFSPFLIYIIKRIMRLLPVYILCIMIYWKLLPYLGDGPIYNFLHKKAEKCSKSYWSDLIFIGNFYKNQCIQQAWYIHADVQLYIACIIILFVYVRFQNKIYCYLLQISIMIITHVYCYTVINKNNYHVQSAGPQILKVRGANFGTQIYQPPWLRTGPYFLGLSLGIYYYNQIQNKKTKGQQFKLVKLLKNRLIRVGMLILGSFFILFLLLIPYQSASGKAIWTQTSHNLHLTFQHLIFQFGIVLIIFPFLFGYRNFIRTFLQFQIFQKISKISFMIYMTHLIVINGLLYSRSSMYRINYHLLLPQIFSGFVITCLVSMVLAFIYQYPVAAIIQYYINYLRDNKEIKQKSDLVDQHQNSYLVATLIFMFLFLIGSFYLGYYNQSCNVFIIYPKMNITISTWLIIDAYALVVIALFLIIISQLKKLKLQFFLQCKNGLKMINVLLVLFELAWLIVGAFMFWGYLMQKNTCDLGLRIYMYIRLIIGFALCIISSLLVKSIYQQNKDQIQKND